jgi:hypothetical protein
VEQAEGLECLVKVLRVRAMPTGLRPSSVVGCGHHLLPVMLSVLLLLIAVMLGRHRVITIIPPTKVGSGFVLATEVGLDSLLAGGIVGGDIQELLHCAGVLRPSIWMSTS